jgi:hypothetical protein
MKELSKASIYLSGVLFYLLDVKKLMQDRGKDTKRIDEQIDNLLKAKDIIENYDNRNQD